MDGEESVTVCSECSLGTKSPCRHLYRTYLQRSGTSIAASNARLLEAIPVVKRNDCFFCNAI